MDSLAPEQKAMYKDAFDTLFDKNKAGFITREQFFSTLESMGVKASPAEQDLVFSQVDRNKDAKITLDEFCLMMAKKRNFAASKEEVANAFKTFEDHPGAKPKVADVAHAMKCVGGNKLTDAQLPDFKSFCDSQQDGKIRAEELAGKLTGCC